MREFKHGGSGKVVSLHAGPLAQNLGAKRPPSPPLVDRKWGILMGSDYNIPKAIFYLLKGDYKHSVLWPQDLKLLASRAETCKILVAPNSTQRSM